jgi:alpha-L-rhamnosidase
MYISKKFISATKQYCTYVNHIPAPYLRRVFNISSDAKTAQITICGLGFYELFINGKRITWGLISPYISNPDDIMFYDLYNIENLLQQGENVIGVILGNGMQNSMGGTWDFDKAAWRSAPKLALCLEIDGKIILEADDNFKTYPSPIIFDELRAGEHFDANKIIDNWADIGFDDSGWENAFTVESPKGITSLNDIPPVKQIKKIQCQKIIKFEDGYIYDFGVNDTGLCELNINGTKGQQIELCYGEYLSEKGVDRTNFILHKTDLNYLQRDIYICKEGMQSYMPHFTYHGFRYVSVKGITEQQATKELLTFLTFHTDMEERGGFECSDAVANKLQENTMRSAYSNFVHFPLDCPHREKNGWTGDAALSSEYMLLNFDASKPFKQWLKCICLAQNEKGALPGIVPTGGWGFEWGNGPAWDAVLTYLPYYLYRFYGDKQVLSDCGEAISKYIDYLSGKRTEKGLIEFGLGDWCQTGRACHDYLTPPEVSNTLISIDICTKAAAIFDAIGDKSKYDKTVKLSDELKAAFNKHLLDESGTVVFGNTQTGQALALFFGIFSGKKRRQAFDVLLNMIKGNDMRYDMGILGLRVLFRLLSQFDMSDLAYDMITSGEYPSYAYYLKYGATTLWEDFQILEEKDGYFRRADGKNVNSLNHHFFGDISGWFIQEISGININADLSDANSVMIKPSFIEKLQFAYGHATMPCGKLQCGWERENDIVKVTVNVPEGCKCNFVAPAGYRIKNSRCKSIKLRSGKNIIECCNA